MDEKPEIMVEPGQRTITLKRVFDAPRQCVFDALTKPENLKRWYNSQDFTISNCDIDFRVGGSWRLLLNAPRGQDHGLSGEYREIVAPERLVQTLHYDGAPHAEAVETLLFVEKEGKTILTSTVLHKSVENRDRHIRSGMEEGATRILDHLADHLQSRDSELPSPISKDHMVVRQRALEISAGATGKAKWDWRMAAVALAVMIFGGGWLYLSLPGGGAAHYVTEIVGRGSVIRIVEANGIINPRTSVQIGAYVSGKIDALYCDRDAKVKAGQLCAKLDPRPYQTVIDREKADLAIAQARLKKDEVRLDRAKAALERNEVLASRGAVSRIVLGNSHAAYEKAQARTTQDEAAIARRRASLHAAEIDLARTEIISPIDGTVASRNVEMGQMIGASKETPLFLVVPDLSIIQVDTKVSAKDIGEIKLGDQASFTVDTLLDRAFTGEVSQISQSPQMVEDFASHDVVISAANPDLSLAPGTKATVQIMVDRRDNVIRVPDRSLRYSASRLDAGDQDLKTPPPGWARLWILRNGKPTAISVRLGLGDGVYTEIVEGDLLPGDQLILG